MFRDFYRRMRSSTPRAEVRRGVMRSTLFAGAMLLVSCRGGVEADGGDVATAASGRLSQAKVVTTALAVTAAAPPTSFLGINLTGAGYYSGDEIYSNLLIGTSWVMPGAGWGDADASLFDQAGNILKLPTGGLVKIMAPPISVMTGAGATIRCTWTGSGTVSIAGPKSPVTAGDHSLEFLWQDNKNGNVWLKIDAMSASDPVRTLDCREKGNTGGLFSPNYIAYLKPFGVLRFMDWQQINGNAKVTWATRTLPTDLAPNAKSESFEHIIALSNEVGADPWVNVPWNADADYVQRMAQIMHDGIPANRKVYVEVSNEVWNASFMAYHQASKEGLTEKLSADPVEAMLFRYAEKVTEVMKVWTQVFADRPGQLVRVAATMDVLPWTGDYVLGFRDTAKWVDALATAPYFGHDLFEGALAGSTDLNALFPVLSTAAANKIKFTVVENQTIAKKYGKRYITYEAGQHVLSTNVPLLTQLNRDPRMYDVYKQYMKAWKAQVNDTMVLFNSNGSVSQFGAWGIREYAGQPLDQTPKLRAVLDVVAGK